jgi:hypothetical protein
MQAPTQSTPPPAAAEDAPRNPQDAVGLYRHEIRDDAFSRFFALYINDEFAGWSDSWTNADRALTFLLADLDHGGLHAS